MLSEKVNFSIYVVNLWYSAVTRGVQTQIWNWTW